MTSEILFDRNLLRQNRARAAKNFAEHNFLHHEVANRIAENVSFLNRKFARVLEIGALDDYLAKAVGVTDSCFYEEDLPNESESFDLIISNLNFHFINEIPQFLLQIKSLLKPDGMFIASFFGEENLSELVHVLHVSENEIYGGISPRMSPTIDVKTAANLLSKAGFKDPISDFSKIEVDYNDPLTLLKDLKNMGQSNILTKRSRRFVGKKFFEKISQNYRKLYTTADEKVIATFEIVTVTGWKN